MRLPSLLSYQRSITFSTVTQIFWRLIIYTFKVYVTILISLVPKEHTVSHGRNLDRQKEKGMDKRKINSSAQKKSWQEIVGMRKWELGVGNSWPAFSLATGFNNSHDTRLNPRVWHGITNSWNLWLWMLYLAQCCTFVPLFPVNVKNNIWTFSRMFQACSLWF